MKNKKFFTGLFVLLAILCLGIGYAVVTKDFNILGTVTTQGADITDPSDPNQDPEELLDQNFLVHFDKTKTSEYVFSNTNNAGKTFDSTKTTCKVVYTDDYNATIDVKGLAELGDTVVITFTVVNDSEDLDADIAAAVLTGADGTSTYANDYFKVEVSDTTGTIAKDGATATFTVTISVIKSAIETQTATFNVDFQATAKLA